MTLSDFKVGDRARVHPASTFFPRGFHWVTVVKVGRKWLTVTEHGWTFKMSPADLTEVDR